MIAYDKPNPKLLIVSNWTISGVKCNNIAKNWKCTDGDTNPVDDEDRGNEPWTDGDIHRFELSEIFYFRPL